MVLKSDKEKVKTLLSETIRLLCKNGLHFKAEFSVEALVGITLDRDEEFFLSIKETVRNDIRPSETPKHRESTREQRRSQNREVLVKGEPGQPSPGQRKRPAETVTSDGSSELPSLTLGDMQEGEQSFWSSVTGDDGGGETNHTNKRKRPDRTDEDNSNSNVIEIKGEPGSDSEEDNEADQDSSQLDMSGTYTYGTPVTSSQGMMAAMPPGSMPPGVWDQLPQYTGMPSTSGMTTQGMSPDAQQQQDGAAMTEPPESPVSSAIDHLEPDDPPRETFGRSPSEAKQERLANLQKDPYYIPRLMRRIMLTKGREVTPKQVYWNFSYRDRPSVALIHQVMKELANKGLGEYGKTDRKTVFAKCKPWTVGGMLDAFGVDIQKYEKQYFALDGNVVPTGKFSPVSTGSFSTKP